MVTWVRQQTASLNDFTVTVNQLSNIILWIELCLIDFYSIYQYSQPLSRTLLGLRHCGSQKKNVHFTLTQRKWLRTLWQEQTVGVRFGKFSVHIWHAFCMLLGSPMLTAYSTHLLTIWNRRLWHALFYYLIDMCIFNNYSSSPNGTWVNSPWGWRPNGLLTQRPWGREEFF